MLKRTARVLLAIAVAAWAALSIAFIETRYGFSNIELFLQPEQVVMLALAVTMPPLTLIFAVLAAVRGRALRVGVRPSQPATPVAKPPVETSPPVPADPATSHALAERALADLIAASGSLAEGFALIEADRAAEMWRRLGQGDRWVFCRLLLPPGADREKQTVFLAERVPDMPEVRARISSFLHEYQWLMAHLRRLRIDPLLREGIEQGPLGQVHALLEAVEHYDSETAARSALIGLPPAATASRVARMLWQRTEVASESNVTPVASAAVIVPSIESVVVSQNVSGPHLVHSAKKSSFVRDIPPAPATRRGTDGVVPFSPLSPGFPRVAFDADEDSRND